MESGWYENNMLDYMKHNPMDFSKKWKKRLAKNSNYSCSKLSNENPISARWKKSRPLSFREEKPEV